MLLYMTSDHRYNNTYTCSCWRIIPALNVPKPVNIVNEQCHYLSMPYNKEVIKKQVWFSFNHI